MNIPTVIILILLAVWLYFALRRSIALGRSGSCASCGGGCHESKKGGAGAQNKEHICKGICASCTADCGCKKEGKGSL